MLSLLKAWLYPKPRFLPFVPPIETMVGCRTCETIVVRHAANRLVVHLIYEHGLSDSRAYDTVDWVFKRVQEYRKGKAAQ